MEPPLKRPKVADKFNLLEAVLGEPAPARKLLLYIGFRGRRTLLLVTRAIRWRWMTTIHGDGLWSEDVRRADAQHFHKKWQKDWEFTWLSRAKESPNWAQCGELGYLALGPLGLPKLDALIMARCLYYNIDDVILLIAKMNTRPSNWRWFVWGDYLKAEPRYKYREIAVSVIFSGNSFHEGARSNDYRKLVRPDYLHGLEPSSYDPQEMFVSNISIRRRDKK
ncbi:MAG: hypothetical protein EHM41_00995 [Chloroflexi bacterium]|nr:MAG: hypothetical protein EHM41_00995 [Chloroflexota bacterium]